MPAQPTAPSGFIAITPDEAKTLRKAIDLRLSDAHLDADKLLERFAELELMHDTLKEIAGGSEVAIGEWLKELVADYHGQIANGLASNTHALHRIRSGDIDFIEGPGTTKKQAEEHKRELVGLVDEDLADYGAMQSLSSKIWWAERGGEGSVAA